jgi:hypothetical protein
MDMRVRAKLKSAGMLPRRWSYASQLMDSNASYRTLEFRVMVGYSIQKGNECHSKGVEINIRGIQVYRNSAKPYFLYCNIFFVFESLH